MGPICQIVLAATAATAQPTLRLDFEAVDRLEECGAFDTGAYLASPGYGGSEQCVARRTESTWAQITYTLPQTVTMREGAALRFAHRVLTEGMAKYVGVYVYTVDGKIGQMSIPTGAEWQVGEVGIIGMGPAGHARNKEPIAAGDVMEKIGLYGRLREHGEQTTYLDDIELTVPGEKPVRPTPAPGAPAEPEPEPGSAAPLREGELFSYDFERGETAAYPQFAGGEIASPGFESEHASSISGDVQFLNLELDCDFILREDMYLECDTKVLTETGSRLYIGLYMVREDGRKLLNSTIASTEDWEPNASREITLWGPAGHSSIQERGVVGERYTKCILYSKLAEKAPQTMIVDNLRLVWEGGSAPIQPPSAVAYRAGGPKTIDGDLSDWTEVDATAALVIGEAAHVHQHSWYQGPADASALVYLLHDSEHLYAAFVVSDDVARNSYAGPTEIYQGDCCLLAFAPRFPSEAAEYARAYMFSPGDFGEVPPAINLSRGAKQTAAECVARKTESGYVIEARIPRDELGFAPREGEAVGCEAMLYDADEPFGPVSREGIYAWASATDRYDPGECGKLTVGATYQGAVAKQPGEVPATALIRQPLVEKGVFTVRPVQRTIAEVGVPLGLFFQRDDVPGLREKVREGRPAACADVLGKTTALYLQDVRPERWDFDALDEPTARLVEEYVVRLSFMYVLTEDSRFAELARRVALKTCSLDWPEGEASVGLQRGIACTLDWIGNALTEEEAATLQGHLPADGVSAPISEVELDFTDVRWAAQEGERFGIDPRLAAVLGPPASWYARTAATEHDPHVQWLGERIWSAFPSSSHDADEVWTIVFHDPGIEPAKPPNSDEALEQKVIERRKSELAEAIRRHRDGPWLPFERDTKQPTREELRGAHPRLLVTPNRTREMLLRGAAIPEALWKPVELKPHTPPAPNRRGNSGGPGYTLLDLAASYLATGQDFYAADAIHIMLCVSEYPHWGGHDHLPADTDLHAGALLFGVGAAYDVFYDEMTADQRQIIREKLIKQARRMYNAHHARGKWAWDQNHTYIDNVGLWCTAVALYDEVPEARDWYDFGVRVMKNGMYVLNGTDGAFYEGIGYWNYGMAMHFVPFLDLFRNVTGVDTFGYFRWLAEDKYYLLHTLMPGGEYHLNLGDVAAGTSARASLWGKRDVMLKAATEYQDPEAQGLADYLTEIGGLGPTSKLWPPLWWDPTVPPENPTAKWPPYHHFDDLDLVCIRTGWHDDATYFALRCGPAPGHRATSLVLNADPPDWSLGTGHVHPDLNSFVIFDHGEHLVVDPGYTVHKLTRNHNTIAVDGGGQIGDGQPWPRFEPWDRFGRIGEFFAAPDICYYLRGEAANGYQEELGLRRFDRHVMMMPGPGYEGTYFVVHDVLESDKPHEYEWLLHSDSEAAIGPDQTYTVTAGQRALTAHLLRPRGLQAETETVRIVPHPGQEHTAVRGKRLGLSPPDPSTNREFLAVLTLHPAGEAGPTVDISGDREAAIVAGRGWTDVLAPSGSGGGLQSDGHHAFVRSADGDVLSWAVLGATGLEWGDVGLVSSDRPVSAAIAAIPFVDQGAYGVVETAEGGEIALHLWFTPEACEVDGKASPVEYDRDGGLARVSLPSGRHVIAFR